MQTAFRHASIAVLKSKNLEKKPRSFNNLVTVAVDPELIPITLRDTPWMGMPVHSLTDMLLGSGNKPENQEETHMDTRGENVWKCTHVVTRT